MSKYGLPYLGSKSKIADDIVMLFPKADNFYDLFAGGCAITHALLTRQQDLFGNGYKRFIINDIQDTPKLFLDAIDGKFKNEKRWISRDEFFKNKELDKPDPYIKWIWSFGNNGKDYFFSKDLEPIKKAFHFVVMFDDWTYYDELTENAFFKEALKEYGIDEPILFLKLYKTNYRIGKGRGEHLRVIKWIQKNYGKENNIYGKANTKIVELQQLERLQQLEQLQQLQQLEQLERLQQLEQDYRDVPILSNSIVYCDIPYNTGLKDYTKNGFNHKEFWEWAEKQPYPVYVSEYSYSGDNPEKWQVVYEKEKINLRTRKSDGTRIINIEKVFWNKLNGVCIEK